MHGGHRRARRAVRRGRGATAGARASGQFFAGWLTEYSLSLDNLFVFVLLIGRSAVPPRLRSRVLLIGIGLALLLRGCVHRGRRGRAEPVRLGALRVRRDAADHRGTAVLPSTPGFAA